MRGGGYGVGVIGNDQIAWYATIAEGHYLSCYVDTIPGNIYQVVVAKGIAEGEGTFGSNGFVLIAYGGDI